MGPTDEHNDGGGINLIFILNSPHPTLLFGWLSCARKVCSATTDLINPPTSLAFEKATVNWARQIPSASSPGTTGLTSQWTRGDIHPPCSYGLSSGLVKGGLEHQRLWFSLWILWRLDAHAHVMLAMLARIVMLHFSSSFVRSSQTLRGGRFFACGFDERSGGVLCTEPGSSIPGFRVSDEWY